MSFKRSDTFAGRPRNYSTREIMEITEERRRKKEAELKEEAEARTEALKNKLAAACQEDGTLRQELPLSENSRINKEIQTFVSQVNIRPDPQTLEGPKEEITPIIEKDDVPLPALLRSGVDSQINEELKPARVLTMSDHSQSNDDIEGSTLEGDPSPVLPQIERVNQANDPAIDHKDLISAKIINGFAVFVLLAMVFFLISTFTRAPLWIKSLASWLNDLIIHASFSILNVTQGSYTLDGTVLNTRYYSVSLQSDWVALRSLEMLVFSAVLFVFVQKTHWIKGAVIFISLLPLMILTNVIRVLWACGLALNYGSDFASQYFHGGLAYFVFIFSFLALIILEFLLSSE